MPWLITAHAVERFRARWYPYLNIFEARVALQKLVASAVHDATDITTNGDRVLVSGEVRMLARADEDVIITVLPPEKPWRRASGRRR